MYKTPVTEKTGAKGETNSTRSLLRLTHADNAGAQGLQVGRRCTVQPSGKSGTIRFVGKVSALPAGFWVGVELDEGDFFYCKRICVMIRFYWTATGRNNGTVKGIKLFSCKDNHGTVLRPSNVEQDY